MATLEGLKAYGYLTDGDFDAATAEMCLAAAKSYLAGSDVPEPAMDNALYDLACYMLAMHWYDHRGVVTLGVVPETIQMGVVSIIHQIRQFPEGV